MPSAGATQRLPRLVGRGKASEMILLGEQLDAAAALACGLVSAVVPAGELHAHGRALAERIAAQGPIAVRYAKEAVLRGLDMPLEQALRYETDLTVILQTTADRAEGVRAFLEKRPADLRGEVAIATSARRAAEHPDGVRELSRVRRAVSDEAADVGAEHVDQGADAEGLLRSREGARDCCLVEASGALRADAAHARCSIHFSYMETRAGTGFGLCAFRSACAGRGPPGRGSSVRVVPGCRLRMLGIAKYPRLPVVRCAGWEDREGGGGLSGDLTPCPLPGAGRGYSAGVTLSVSGGRVGCGFLQAGRLRSFRCLSLAVRSGVVVG